MSNSQILIIHKFPILFNILNEFKSKLNFKIESVDHDKISNELEKTIKLIISSEKNFETENQIKINHILLN